MVRTRRPAQTVPEPIPEADTLDTLPLNVIPIWPGVRVGEPAPHLARDGGEICASEATSAQICAGQATSEKGKKRSKGSGLPGAMSSSQVREHEDVSPTRANGVLPDAEFLALVERLPAMALRERFPLDAHTHNNMLRRRGKEYAGCTVAPEFKSFRSFLRHMGKQRPSVDWTLDRKDPSRMEYGPGLVRWADKREQANNRRSTHKLRGPGEEVRPLTDWARLTEQKPKTIRKRIERGWRHAEAVAGRRGVLSPETPDPVRPPRPVTMWPEGTKQPSVWEAAWLDFGRRFPSNLSRAAFLAWVCSNVARQAYDRLRHRFPAFEDGYGDEPPGYAEDADRLMLDSAEERIRAAHHDMAGDRKQHEAVSALVRRWPHVRHPADVAKLVSRDDDE